MPLAEGQMSLRSLTMGDGNPFIVVESSLWDSPDVVSDDAERSGTGLSVGADRLAGKATITVIRIVGNDASDIVGDVEDLKAAWAPTDGGLVALTYNVDGTERQVFGRPRGADVALSEVGHPAECRFMQTDPYVYTTATTNTNVAEAGSAAIGNTGNVEAPFVITIPGPCTVPQVSRTDSSSYYCYKFPGLTVASGKSLVINTRTRTAIYDGTTDYWHTMVDTTGRPSPLWGIKAGGSTVAFEAATGTPTAVVTAYNAVTVG